MIDRADHIPTSGPESSPASPADDAPEVQVQAIPLTQLPRGARATLHQRQLGCEDCELLNAMGMTERCRLKVCRAGHPCIVQVASTRLGISSSMADQIMVLPDPRPRKSD